MQFSHASSLQRRPDNPVRIRTCCFMLHRLHIGLPLHVPPALSKMHSFIGLGHPYSAKHWVAQSESPRQRARHMAPFLNSKVWHMEKEQLMAPFQSIEKDASKKSSKNSPVLRYITVINHYRRVSSNGRLLRSIPAIALPQSATALDEGLKLRDADSVCPLSAFRIGRRNSQRPCERQK